MLERKSQIHAWWFFCKALCADCHNQQHVIIWVLQSSIKLIPQSGIVVPLFVSIPTEPWIAHITWWIICSQQFVGLFLFCECEVSCALQKWTELFETTHQEMKSNQHTHHLVFSGTLYSHAIWNQTAVACFFLPGKPTRCGWQRSFWMQHFGLPMENNWINSYSSALWQSEDENWGAILQICFSKRHSWDRWTSVLWHISAKWCEGNQLVHVWHPHCWQVGFPDISFSSWVQNCYTIFRDVQKTKKLKLLWRGGDRKSVV